jgi:hypothetical protein
MEEVRVSVMRRAFACVALVGMVFMLASCGLNPLDLGGGSPPAASQTATPTASATSTPAAAAPKSSKFASSPKPPPADPLLDTGSWGYLDMNDVVKKRTGVTSALHQSIVDERMTKLTNEEWLNLLKVFRNSPKVKRAIKAAGGRSSEATYSVIDIQASEDVGIDTPWVYATLRANFPTRNGQKGLECDVYRQKSSKGLDRRPLVSSAIVGYVRADDTLEQGAVGNPVRVKLR